MLVENKKVKLKYIPILPNGELDIEKLDNILQDKDCNFFHLY